LPIKGCWGLLSKQRTCTLQLLLGAHCKAVYLHITVAIGSLLKAVYLHMICFGVYHMSG